MAVVETLSPFLIISWPLRLQFLDMLHDANEQGHQVLPYTEFYSQDLSNVCNLREEFHIWTQHGQRKGPSPTAGLASICQVRATQRALLPPIQVY